MAPHVAPDSILKPVPAPAPVQDRLPLSGFIICQNEEEYLGKCIESLEQCAEIVIVDSGSTDGTEALVQRYTEAGWPIRFMYEKWRGYAAQKQFAFEQCTQPWCFSIDSDERIDDALKQALPELLQAPESVVGFRIARRPYLIGYGYTPTYVSERKNLRLIRYGKGRFDMQLLVHEGIIPDGTVKPSLRGSLLHYRPLPIEEQILKENKYSSLKAQQLMQRGSPPRRARLVVCPLAYFLRLYIKNRLFLCGFPGFIQAMTGGVYSFLTEAKVYQQYKLRTRSHQDICDAPPEFKRAA